MKKLFALLVGINDYPSPTTPLEGCLKDVGNIRKFIEDHLSNVFEIAVLELLNEQATYEGIKTAFKTHLRQAGDGDSIWFHYSGHGSEELTAIEFQTTETAKKDQTLVCFDSRDTQKSLDLADKELAVLLHEVSTLDPEGKLKNGKPQIFVSLDSCHSGTGTRLSSLNPGMKSRNIPSRTNELPRHISTYANGFFIKNGIQSAIPLTDHILFSACKSVQLAGDEDTGGLFSSCLIKCLLQSGTKVTYSDLFRKVQAEVIRLKRDQTPQFETIGDTNPDAFFLQDNISNESDFFPVFFNEQDSKWYVKFGLLHFMPESSDERVIFEIFSDVSQSNSLGQAVAGKVDFQKSELLFENEEPENKNDIYKARLILFPAENFLVDLKGDSGQISKLEEIWDKTKNVLPLSIGQPNAEPSLELELNADKNRLLDLKSGLPHNEFEDLPFNNLPDILNKIAFWHRFRNLANINSQLHEIVEWEIDVIRITAGVAKTKSHTGENLILSFARIGNMNVELGFVPKIKITNASKDLYVYFFNLGPDYSVVRPKLAKKVVFNLEELGTDSEWIHLLESPQGLSISPQTESFGFSFKLIVSEVDLEYHKLLQNGILGDAAFPGLSRLTVSFGSNEPQGTIWMAQTINVRIDITESGSRGEIKESLDPEIEVQSENGIPEPAQALKNNRGELLKCKSYAFIIGINSYERINANLISAVPDAIELEKVLREKQSFDQVELLLNATGAEIRKLLKKLADPQRKHGIKKDDCVVFYYAGHGKAGEIDNGPAGYILPSDTSPQATALDNGTLIPMMEIFNALDALDCKHTLLILDCCFAGNFKFVGKKRDTFTPFFLPLYNERYERFKRKRAWQVLVSAGSDQTAADWLGDRSVQIDPSDMHSPFAKALFEALGGKAEIKPKGKNLGDGAITTQELFLYLWNEIETLTKKHKDFNIQYPEIFPMGKHDGGEFIFFDPNNKLNFPDRVQRNPYKGLHPYRVEDNDLFFGRKYAINQIVERLFPSEENSVWQNGEMKPEVFMVITAPSGLGKSSVVTAGVFPALAERHKYEKLHILRPGSNPMQKFTELGELNTNKMQVLLIDQYEELFTESADPKEKEEFEKAIIGLVEKIGEGYFRVIITIRSDFEWQLEQSLAGGKDWQLKPEFLQKSLFRLAPLSLDELRDALTGPAWVEAFEFDTENLINTIVEDISYAPGAMPLLSYTMSLLYEITLAKNERIFTLKAYRDELGGVNGALKRKATEIYDGLPDDAHRKTMRMIMLRMVNLKSGGYVRRKVFLGKSGQQEVKAGLNELDFPSDILDQRIQLILQRMSEAQLVIRDEERGKPYVEPAHDSLINFWPTCLKWISDFGDEQIILQRQLWESVRKYTETSGSDGESVKQKKDLGTSFLWNSDPRLDQVVQVMNSGEENWLNESETDFVEKSRHSREKVRVRLTKMYNDLEISRVMAPWAEAVETDPTKSLKLAAYAYQINSNDHRSKAMLWGAYFNRSLLYKSFNLGSSRTLDFTVDNVLTWNEFDKTLYLRNFDAEVLASLPVNNCVRAQWKGPDGKIVVINKPDLMNVEIGIWDGSSDEMDVFYKRDLTELISEKGWLNNHDDPYEINIINNYIKELFFTEDFEYFVLVYPYDGFIEIINYKNQNSIVRLETKMSFQLRGLYFAPGNSDRVIINSKGDFEIWEWKDGPKRLHSGQNDIKLPYFNVNFHENGDNIIQAKEGRILFSYWPNNQVFNSIDTIGLHPKEYLPDRTGNFAWIRMEEPKIILWDCGLQQKQFELKADLRKVKTIKWPEGQTWIGTGFSALTLDGEFTLTDHTSHIVRKWYQGKFKTGTSMKGFGKPLQFARFSHDLKFAVAVSAESAILIQSPGENDQQQLFKCDMGSVKEFAMYSGKSRNLLAFASGNIIKMINLDEELSEVKSLFSQRNLLEPQDLLLCRSGDQLIIAGDGNELAKVNGQGGAAQLSNQNKNDPKSSQKGYVFDLGSLNKVAKFDTMLQIQENFVSRFQSNDEMQIRNLCESVDGLLLAAASIVPNEEGIYLDILDYDSIIHPTSSFQGENQKRASVKCPGEIPTSIVFSLDKKLVFCATNENTVLVWDWERNVLRSPLIGHNGEINEISFSKDNHFIITSSSDGTVRLWDWESNQVGIFLGNASQPEVFLAAGMSDDMKTLTAIAGNSGQIIEWQIDPVEIMNEILETGLHAFTEEEKEANAIKEIFS